MSYQDYLPMNWMRNRRHEEHPLISLRKEVDSLFDDFGNGIFSGGDDFSVRSNVSETDTEFCVTGELPGMTQADVDVSVSGDRIVIKGEKNPRKKKSPMRKAGSFTVSSADQARFSGL